MFAQIPVSVTIEPGRPLGDGYTYFITEPRGHDSFYIHREFLSEMLESAENFAKGMETIRQWVDCQELDCFMVTIATIQLLSSKEN